MRGLVTTILTNPLFPSFMEWILSEERDRESWTRPEETP